MKRKYKHMHTQSTKKKKKSKDIPLSMYMCLNITIFLINFGTKTYDCALIYNFSKKKTTHTNFIKIFFINVVYEGLVVVFDPEDFFIFLYVLKMIWIRILYRMNRYMNHHFIL